MKKIFVIFSLVSFVAVNVAIAKDPQPTAPAKKEVVAKTDEKAATPATATPACCKGKSVKDCSAEMKGYTSEQKAACMKTCSGGEKAKADVGTEKKVETKAINN